MTVSSWQISKWVILLKFIETRFLNNSEWDLIRKVIKTGIMFISKEFENFINKEEKQWSKKWTFFLLII